MDKQKLIKHLVYHIENLERCAKADPTGYRDTTAAETLASLLVYVRNGEFDIDDGGID